MPEITKPTAQQPTQSQELPTVRRDNFVRVYANAANMEVTPWDFKITFGELKRSDGTMVIEQSAEITMSPQHAKAMAEILQSNVRSYEQSIGEIKMPPKPGAEETKPQTAVSAKPS